MAYADTLLPPKLAAALAQHATSPLGVLAALPEEPALRRWTLAVILERTPTLGPSLARVRSWGKSEDDDLATLTGWAQATIRRNVPAALTEIHQAVDTLRSLVEVRGVRPAWLATARCAELARGSFVGSAFLGPEGENSAFRLWMADPALSREDLVRAASHMSPNAADAWWRHPAMTPVVVRQACALPKVREALALAYTRGQLPPLDASFRVAARVLLRSSVRQKVLWELATTAESLDELRALWKADPANAQADAIRIWWAAPPTARGNGPLPDDLRSALASATHATVGKDLAGVAAGLLAADSATPAEFRERLLSVPARGSFRLIALERADPSLLAQVILPPGVIQGLLLGGNDEDRLRAIRLLGHLRIAGVPLDGAPPPEDASAVPPSQPPGPDPSPAPTLGPTAGTGPRGHRPR